ncbi:MAG: hypothetical protein VX341_06305 [Bdellovibrionota bacterium]|nr:hypothetical protein [Bdellovibrionota bacterium]
MLRSVRICLFGTFIIFADPTIALERSCTSYIQLIYGMNKDKVVSELDSLEGVFKVNKTFREKVLKASLDKDSRELMTESILGSMRKSSKKLTDRMKDKGDSGYDEVSQVHDVFIIGAGLQSSILAQGIKQTNKDIKTMVVEETDMVASTFAMSPNYFRINSSNRAENFAKEAVPGSGNLNRSSGGSVQIPDFEANKYPRAGAMSDIALYNLFESEAEVMFKTKFVKTEKRGPNDDWPAKYRITVRRGNVEYYQYANKVINATGLGKEKYGVSDEKSLEFIQRELLKGLETTADSTSVPKIMSFNETRRLNELMDSPYSPYVGKKVMVVGNGDSGKVTIEHLFREGPEDGYKKDKAQNGLISKLIWAGQKEQDCDEYVTTNRVRYAGISAAYKNGTLKPVASKVVKYEEELGGVKVTFEDGRVEFVDHVIISTGFEKEYGEGYREFVGDEAPANLEKGDNILVDVKGRIKEARDGDFTTVGVQLTNTDGEKEDIYFAGPMINLIREGEEGLQAGVSQNSVSKFINGPRNYTLASLIAESTTPIGAKRFSDDSEGVLSLPTRERRVSYKLGDDVAAAKVTGYNEKFVLANFLSTLENFNLDSFKNNSLDINITLKDGELVFSLFDGGSEEFAQIVSEVLADKKTRSILKQIIVDEGDDLNARIAIDDKGEIVYDESKIVRAFRSGNYLDVEYRADPSKYVDQAQSMVDILKENILKSFNNTGSTVASKSVGRRTDFAQIVELDKTVRVGGLYNVKLSLGRTSDGKLNISLRDALRGPLNISVDPITNSSFSTEEFVKIDEINVADVEEVFIFSDGSTRTGDLKVNFKLKDGSYFIANYSQAERNTNNVQVYGYKRNFIDTDSQLIKGSNKVKIEDYSKIFEDTNKDMNTGRLLKSSSKIVQRVDFGRARRVGTIKNISFFLERDTNRGLNISLINSNGDPINVVLERLTKSERNPLENISVDDISDVYVNNAVGGGRDQQARVYILLKDRSLIVAGIRQEGNSSNTVLATIVNRTLGGEYVVEVNAASRVDADRIVKLRDGESVEDIDSISQFPSSIKCEGLLDSAGLGYDVNISLLKDKRIALTLATEEGAIKPVDDSVSEILKDKTVSDIKNVYVVRASTGEDYIRIIYNDESYDDFYVNKDRDNENVDTLFEYPNSISNDTVRRNGKLIFSR